MEKLVSNVFFRNVYFMEHLQAYVDSLLQSPFSHVDSVLTMLQMYHSLLQTYRPWATKKSPNNTSYLKLIYSHIEHLLCCHHGRVTHLLQEYLHEYTQS